MGASWEELGVSLPQILLPKEGTDLTKWAVVACAQFTSEPEYWHDVEKIVSGAPSTLSLMLPEAYLGAKDLPERIAAIHGRMNALLDEGFFRALPEGTVLVERTADGKTRHGLMLAFDLEQYDYKKGSTSLIRATEGTVESRIPPRLKVRQGAALELPHILILIDDPEHTVIEPLIGKGEKIYDFDLMQRGGHIEGRFLENSALCGLKEALSALKNRWENRCGAPLLLYAMGDGNHSLATAKAAWEQLRPTLSEEERMCHPARYALCELENLHDAGIVFEPIHRVAFGAGEPEAFLNALREILSAQNPGGAVSVLWGEAAKRETSGHRLDFSCAAGTGSVLVERPASQLPAGTLEQALEAWKAQSEAGSIDYIHGGETARRLGAQPGAMAFLLPAMEKEALFTTVILDGALPKKTFSLGEANEKRYYLEARSLRPAQDAQKKPD